MRIPQKSNKDTVVIVASLIFIVGLFVFLQKYENARFHKDVTPRMFAQRGIASVEESR